MGVTNFDAVHASEIQADELKVEGVKADEVKVGDAAVYPVLMGDTAPATSTEGAVGQFYCDKTNKKLWICTAAGSTYTWLGVAIA